MKAEELPLQIKRRLKTIDDIFQEITKSPNFNEFDDLDDFHSSIVHYIAEELCDDLDSYNFYYNFLDDFLNKEIQKVWRRKKKFGEY